MFLGGAFAVVLHLEIDINYGQLVTYNFSTR